MREILFRGKRLDDGEWVEGSYVCQYGRHYIYLLYGADGQYVPEYYSVDPSTVGQYTGLTDKNGKKIFEGDILHYTGMTTEYDDFCYVVFECAEFALKFITMDKQTMAKNELELLPLQRGLFDFCRESNSFEVIGNIHDNPELLRAE